MGLTVKVCLWYCEWNMVQFHRSWSSLIRRCQTSILVGMFTPHIIYHFLWFCRNARPKQKSNSKNIADKANLLNEWSEQVISEHYRSIGSCNLAVRGMQYGSKYKKIQIHLRKTTVSNDPPRPLTASLSLAAHFLIHFAISFTKRLSIIFQ